MSVLTLAKAFRNFYYNSVTHWELVMTTVLYKPKRRMLIQYMEHSNGWNYSRYKSQCSSLPLFLLKHPRIYFAVLFRFAVACPSRRWYRKIWPWYFCKGHSHFFAPVNLSVCPSAHFDVACLSFLILFVLSNWMILISKMATGLHLALPVKQRGHSRIRWRQPELETFTSRHRHALSIFFFFSFFFLAGVFT